MSIFSKVGKFAKKEVHAAGQLASKGAMLAGDCAMEGAMSATELVGANVVKPGAFSSKKAYNNSVKLTAKVNMAADAVASYFCPAVGAALVLAQKEGKHNSLVSTSSAPPTSGAIELQNLSTTPSALNAQTSGSTSILNELTGGGSNMIYYVCGAVLLLIILLRKK